MPDSIEDEAVLNLLMEDAAFYARKKDVVDELKPSQLKELDKAIEKQRKMKPCPGMNSKRK